MARSDGNKLGEVLDTVANLATTAQRMPLHRTREIRLILGMLCGVIDEQFEEWDADVVPAAETSAEAK